MGRGRSKAKQTKVARRLKYADGGADLARLQTELATTRTTASEAEDAVEAESNGGADLARFQAELSAMRESATANADPETEADSDEQDPAPDDAADPASPTRRRRIRSRTDTDQQSDS